MKQLIKSPSVLKWTLISAVTGFTGLFHPSGSAADAATEGAPIHSIYTDRIKALGKSWPPAQLKDWRKQLETADKPFVLLPVRTTGNDTFIGLIQLQKIRVSLDRVFAVLENYSEYTEIFDDLIKSEMKNREKNHWVVFSEQHIGVPFVPNERNEVDFTLTSHSSPERRIYTYQLIKSNHQKSNDGILVIEALSATETLFTEIDLWDADYGIAKSLGTDKIWKDSMAGILQSDIALRIKAENPNWKNERVKKVSEEFSRKIDLEAPLKNRKTWEEVL